MAERAAAGGACLLAFKQLQARERKKISKHAKKTSKRAKNNQERRAFGRAWEDMKREGVQEENQRHDRRLSIMEMATIVGVFSCNNSGAPTMNMEKEKPDSR